MIHTSLVLRGDRDDNEYAESRHEHVMEWTLEGACS